MNKKVVFRSFSKCSDCPYFRHQSEFDRETEQYESWYQCGFTDKIIISEEDATKRAYGETPDEIFKIPSWCPLEDYDLFYKALEVIQEQ